MQRYLSILLVSMLWQSCIAFGQSSSAPLVMYSEGTVTSKKGVNAPAQPVYTGIYLTADSELEVASGGQVEISYQDKYVTLKPGNYRISEVFGEAANSTGFLKRFTDFVSKGLEQSADQESLEKAYLSNQGNAQGNIRGLGDKGLTDLYPFGGRLVRDVTRFSWPRGEAEVYDFRIVDSLSQEAIVTARVADNAIALNLADLYLSDEAPYYWEVIPIGVPATRSPGLGSTRGPAPIAVIRFTIGPDSAADILRPTADYQQAGGKGQRLLMEAMLYENRGYLSEADKTYRKGVADDPQNELLRRSYAAFLARWNRREDALELLQK